MKFTLALACAMLALTAAAPNLKDIARAIEKRPRDEFRGVASLSHTNAVLNGHLIEKTGLTTKACESLTAAQIQDVQRIIYAASHPELLSIYTNEEDPRAQPYASSTAMEAAWTQSAKLVTTRPELAAILRDGLCHEAVMWFTHHLTTETQQELAAAGLELPLLPLREHTAAVTTTDPATQAVHKGYMAAVTCQKCHVGGIANLGVPDVKPVTQKELSRRCYSDYEDLFGIKCKPCDGIAGVYWGDDDDKYFTADPCSVIGTPESIAEADRVPAAFPPQFSVDVVAGSDRWGRTTNPAGKGPFPPLIDSMYGQITGKWFTDITADSDLWLLRHDTSYKHVSFNGTHVPAISFHVSEMHSQTKAQQAVNCTGPMVSLVKGLPSIIPGGCTCVADPVGVPDIAHERTVGLDNNNMKYLGRINITLDEHKGESVVVDHWFNWFFHVFMEIDKSVPHYGKAPKRLASAYAGTATYENWDLTDPKIKDPTVWFRGIPTSPMKVGPDKGKFCINPQKISDCVNISQSTFPPAPEAAPVVQEAQQEVPWHIIHKNFLPAFDKVQAKLTELTTGH